MPTRTLALAALLLFSCSGGDGGGGTGGGGGSSAQAPTLTGDYAFDAGTVLSSSQTSGGGQTPGDNLHVGIEEGCSGFGDRTLALDLYSRDHSMLAAGTYPVELPSSGTGGNLFANVSLTDFSGGTPQYDAVSGTVTMDAVDFASLQNNRGSFQVQLGFVDGGSSALSGTFDGRYLCH
jgi:hypothetical protein